MVVTALVMAGGKATRMNPPVEKPLLRVGPKTLIEYVLEALSESKVVDRIVVATSRYTPKTALKVREMYEIIETPGEGYVSDARYAIEKLKLEEVVVVSADLPFLQGSLVDAAVDRFRCCGKPALAVVVPLETCKRLGITPEHTIESERGTLIPVGVNVIDGRRVSEQSLAQELFVVDVEVLAVNVDTQDDLELAREIYARKLSDCKTPYPV
jgi:adenosylcobinamide-phosphate guanylyltransferase